jgi:hypothetical protein
MPGKGWLNKRRRSGHSNAMGEVEAKSEAALRQEWRNGVSNSAPVKPQTQAYTPASQPQAYAAPPASGAPGGAGDGE